MTVIKSCEVNESGFTLLETLVAFVILAISLAVAVRTVSFSIHNSERSRIQAEMRHIARAVLLENSSHSTGQYEQDGHWGGDYSWRFSIAPINVKSTQNIRQTKMQISHDVPPLISTTYISFVEQK